MGEPRKILIAEDEPTLRKMLVSMLSRKGYACATVGDGIEACMSAETDPPDLVLLDVLLPGRDGYTVLLHLRSRPATNRTPVLFLSGEAAEDHEEIARTLGAQGFLTKPITSEKLYAAIEGALGDEKGAHA